MDILYIVLKHHYVTGPETVEAMYLMLDVEFMM